MNRLNFPGRLLVLSIAALLTACATSHTIHSQVDPGANFAAYKTFGFFDEVMGQQDPYATFLDQHLKNAIANELQLRGYQRDKNPDLLVNYHVQAKNQVKVTQTAQPAGYYGYRRGYYAWGAGTAYSTSVQTYREGTLNIDIVDAAARKMLWEGIAIGRISESMREDPKAAVDDAVNQIFVEFPGRR